MRTSWALPIALLFVGGCALPQPTHIERQDFVPKKEVALADIVRTAQEDYSRGRMLDAELGLRKALVLAPDVTQIVLNLGKTLAKNGQSEEAQRVFDRVLLRKERDPEILNFIGESFFEGDEIERARDYFARAQRIIDESAQTNTPVASGIVERTLRNIGTLAFREGNLTRALCSVQGAFEISQSADNLIRLARLESARGAAANVENLISTFLTLTPGNNDPRLYLLRAIARAAQNKKEQVIEDINAALKREEQILEFALELRLMAAAYIPPLVDEDGETHAIGDAEEEDTVPEPLNDIQRLYIPGSVLEELDAYRARRIKEIEES